MFPKVPSLSDLTPREMEALHWLAEGKQNGEIGLILGCGEDTVKKHVLHIYRKLGVENRVAAANFYREAMAATAS